MTDSVRQSLEDTVGAWLFDPVVARLSAALLGLVVLNVLFRLMKRTASRHLTDADARYRARKALGLLNYAAAVFLLALIFKNQLGGLTIAFGVAGAGIAFALQEVIASVAGWAAVSFGAFFRVGDRVQLGGIKGDVIDIGVLRTTLMECGQWVAGDLYNGRIVRVANSFVFKEPVVNYSGDFSFLWDEITLPVRYGSDLDAARRLIEETANEVVGDYVPQARTAWSQMVQKYRIEDARVEPMVTLIANDNWVEFTLRYVVDYRRRRLSKDRLFTRLLEEIGRTDGRVALASATFALVEAPRLEVSMRPEAPRNT